MPSIEFDSAKRNLFEEIVNPRLRTFQDFSNDLASPFELPDSSLIRVEAHPFVFGGKKYIPEIKEEFYEIHNALTSMLEVPHRSTNLLILDGQRESSLKAVEYYRDHVDPTIDRPDRFEDAIMSTGGSTIPLYEQIFRSEFPGSYYGYNGEIWIVFNPTHLKISETVNTEDALEKNISLIITNHLINTIAQNNIYFRRGEAPLSDEDRERETLKKIGLFVTGSTFFSSTFDIMSRLILNRREFLRGAAITTGAMLGGPSTLTLYDYLKKNSPYTGIKDAGIYIGKKHADGNTETIFDYSSTGLTSMVEKIKQKLQDVGIDENAMLISLSNSP